MVVVVAAVAVAVVVGRRSPVIVVVVVAAAAGIVAVVVVVGRGRPSSCPIPWRRRVCPSHLPRAQVVEEEHAAGTHMPACCLVGCTRKHARPDAQAIVSRMRCVVMVVLTIYW